MRREDGDRGAALIGVIILGFVMMTLVATGLSVATSGLQQAVGVQRSSSALDAAFAGVQDYLARVNLDKTYIKYGNPDSPFTTSSGSTVARPTPWNPAFGFGVKNGSPKDQYATWATVPGSGQPASGQVSAQPPAKFRYEVDTSTYKTTGIVRLQVTGVAGDRTRTLLASLRVKGFVDYAYFTDYEIKDPSTYVRAPGETFDPATCVKYAWAGRSATCNNKMQVAFKKDDVLYGDVHTNDTPVLTCGMSVSGVFETSTPTSNSAVYNKAKSCTPPVPLKYTDTLAMPATNQAMRVDAGCVYTGPTRITYNGDGTMTVVSPWSRYTDVSSAPSNPTRCGAPSALHSASGARVQQLDQDLLYVQSVRGSATDPNYWAPGDKPASVTCIAPDGSETTAATGIGWSVGTGGSQIRYPLVGESPATGWADPGNSALWNTLNPAYGCRSGDLYLSGQVTTVTSAASDNYIYVVDDLTYKDKNTDLLGLVAQSSVNVWNPMSASNDQPMLNQYNLEIDAAIVSVAHTFRVQNHDRGATRGALEVFGSIAQEFRGTVGAAYIEQTTGATVYTGYSKAYQYDTKLKTVSPPKFLSPSATSFAVVRYTSVPAAYTPQGAPTP